MIRNVVAGGRPEAVAPDMHPTPATHPLHATPTPGGLSARFMGVSTILLDDGATAIMTDGFFSRPGKRQLVTGRIGSDMVRIKDALARAETRKLAALFVAHAHYDHALDCVDVAIETHAILHGSESVANLARGHRKDGVYDFPEARVRVIEARHAYTFGDFSVTAHEAPHSPLALFPGRIAHQLHTPTMVCNYRAGCNYSFFVDHPSCRILIHPSANYAPAMFAGEQASVVFLGIGTLGRHGDAFVTAYWNEVVRTTGAKLVVPIHWDDFTRPLDQPLRPTPKPADFFDRAMEGIWRLAARDDVVIKFMAPFEVMDVGQAVANAR